MQKMIKFICAVSALCAYSLQAASWCDSMSQWLEQEVPVCEVTSQQYAWMQQHASPRRSQDEVIVPIAPFNKSTKTLASMLNGSRSDQLQASAYLQEAIDNHALTPKTRLLVAQHAAQLHIPRDEQLKMLSELLQNSDHKVQLAALRVAEKEMSESELSETCWCIAGATLSGLGATIFGPLAGLAGSLATMLSLRDPAHSMLSEKINAVKASLAKAKLKTE